MLRPFLEPRDYSCGRKKMTIFHFFRTSKFCADKFEKKWWYSTACGKKIMIFQCVGKKWWYSSARKKNDDIPCRKENEDIPRKKMIFQSKKNDDIPRKKMMITVYIIIFFSNFPMCISSFFSTPHVLIPHTHTHTHTHTHQKQSFESQSTGQKPESEFFPWQWLKALQFELKVLFPVFDSPLPKICSHRVQIDILSI